MQQPNFYTNEEGGDWKVWPREIILKKEDLLTGISRRITGTKTYKVVRFPASLELFDNNQAIWVHSILWGSFNDFDKNIVTRWDCINGFTHGKEKAGDK